MASFSATHVNLAHAVIPGPWYSVNRTLARTSHRRDGLSFPLYPATRSEVRAKPVAVTQNNRIGHVS